MFTRNVFILGSALCLVGCASYEGLYAPSCLAYSGSEIRRWHGRDGGREVGVVVGGVAGLWLAELLRLRDVRAAWDTTWKALQGYGIGTLIQMLAGAAIFGVWLAGVWIS